MTIRSIQKVIKVGSSLAVTIPAREAKAANITAGTEVEFQVDRLRPEVDAHQTEIVALTQQLIERHQTALNNLSQR